MIEFNNIALWVGLAVLLLAIALWGHRRESAARARAERVRRYIEEEDLGGNSYFMPLPKIEEAVEIERTVEIDSLLSGESSTVAAAARAELEAPTDLQLTGPTTGVPLPELPRVTGPDLTRAIVPPLPSAVEQPRHPSLDVAEDAPVEEPNAGYPVRELVLAWFEARGYRASHASEVVPPIELVLRHRSDRGRAYAFVSMREPPGAERARDLCERARSMGVDRLLLAVQTKKAPRLPPELSDKGLRQYDESSIRNELERIDIRVAAKIIAVARKRFWLAAARGGAGRGS